MMRFFTINGSKNNHFKYLNFKFQFIGQIVSMYEAISSTMSTEVAYDTLKSKLNYGYHSKSCFHLYIFQTEHI